MLNLFQHLKMDNKNKKKTLKRVLPKESLRGG